MSVVDPFDCIRQLECMSEIDPDDIDDNLEAMSEIDDVTILSRFNNLAGRLHRGGDNNGDGNSKPSAASTAAEAPETEIVQAPFIIDIAAAAAYKAARLQYQLPMLKTSNEAPQLAIAVNLDH